MVQRDDGLWFILISDIVAATQARGDEERAEMVRDLVAVTIDMPPGAFDIRLVEVDSPVD